MKYISISVQNINYRTLVADIKSTSKFTIKVLVIVLSAKPGDCLFIY